MKCYNCKTLIFVIGKRGSLILTWPRWKTTNKHSFLQEKVKSLLMGVEYPNVAKFQSTWEHYYINVKIHTYGGHVPTSFRFPDVSIKKQCSRSHLFVVFCNEYE